MRAAAMSYGGDAAGAYRKMVLEQQIAVDTEGGIHPVGDLFDYNGPTLMRDPHPVRRNIPRGTTIAAYDGTR